MSYSLWDHLELKNGQKKRREIRESRRKSRLLTPLTSLPQGLLGPLPLQNRNIAKIGQRHFAECCPDQGEMKPVLLPSSEGSATHPATGEGTIGRDRQQTGPSRDRKLGTVRTGIGLANLLRFCSLQDAFLEPLQTRWYMGTSGYRMDHLGLYGRVGRGEIRQETYKLREKGRVKKDKCLVQP